MSMWYLCIDLKSFYASVECVERGLDPMTTNLIVADPERGTGTICLAVSPSMKALGVKNRCRVFEIPKTIPYITAPPRMQKYIDYAATIYGIYLRWISPDDIHVYSIDEAFLDVSPYLSTYGKTPKEMAKMLTEAVYRETGVRATCGIGTNLYLTKIALDIVAKRAEDFIGILDEETYRETLWDHIPLTDFWRIGPGTASRLAKYGMYTMRSVAEAEETFLYKLFGIDAELLIDHAWGRESCTMADIKAYKPRTKCLSTGQVLMRDYAFDEARLIVKEMADGLILDLSRNGLETTGIALCVSYSHSLALPPVRGTAPFDRPTNVRREIMKGVLETFDRITDARLPVRRLNLTALNLTVEGAGRQLSFGDIVQDPASCFYGERERERNRREQEAILEIQRRYGKNALLKGMDFESAATTRERNNQIGGHKRGE